MPDAAEIIIFDLSGRTRMPDEEGQAERSTKTKTDADQAVHRSPKADAALMNKQADKLARELEAEILAAMPPDPTLGVRAELRFHKGSLVMIGTVALLSWTGSIVLDAVKDELSAIIKIALQRVIAAALGPDATMDCSVKPRPRGAGAAPGPAMSSWQGRFSWRDILLIILTLAVLLLLFNSAFDVRLRGPDAPPAAAPLSPP
jgi:hypothetical protein